MKNIKIISLLITITFFFIATINLISKDFSKKEIEKTAIETSLNEISQNPIKYSTKIVKLKGYAKGWAVQDLPKEIKELFLKLPYARNNTGLTRSWGSFTDGKEIILYPYNPAKWAKLIVYAKIKIKEKRWYIDPIFEKIIYQNVN